MNAVINTDVSLINAESSSQGGFGVCLVGLFLLP